MLNYTKQSFDNRNTDIQNSPKTTWGFQIRRAKVRFQGNVIDPSWKYQINGEFNALSGRYDFAEALIQKVFDNGIVLTMGQFKTPWLREELVSSSRQLAVERSVVNELFTQDRAVGLQLRWTEPTTGRLAGVLQQRPANALIRRPDPLHQLHRTSPTKWAFSRRGRMDKLCRRLERLQGLQRRNRWVRIRSRDARGRRAWDSSTTEPAVQDGTSSASSLRICRDSAAELTFANSTVWGVTADISAKIREPHALRRRSHPDATTRQGGRGWTAELPSN